MFDFVDIQDIGRSLDTLYISFIIKTIIRLPQRSGSKIIRINLDQQL